MVRKPCVIFLSIPCHWNQMVIFWPQVLHLTRDFRILKIQSFVLSDNLNLAFHLPSSLHTSSFFWNYANVPKWPKKRLIFLNLSKFAILAAKKREANKLFKFRNNDVYINEHLSKTNRAIFGAAQAKKKLLNYKYCWTRGGTVLMRKTEDSEVFTIQRKATWISWYNFKCLLWPRRFFSKEEMQLIGLSIPVFESIIDNFHTLFFYKQPKFWPVESLSKRFLKKTVEPQIGYFQLLSSICLILFI